MEWAWGWVASGNMMQSLNHGDARSGCQWGVGQAKRTLTRGKPALDTLQPRVLEDVSLQVLPVKRKLSCSSHLSSLPITPHPEGSEVGAEQRGVNEKIKDTDSTSPSLVLWQEPAEVEA